MGTKLSESTDLATALECTICLDVPASPIHNCKNGHIVCGICKEKLALCGICKTGLEVSIVLERLSKQFDLKATCKYSSSGCEADVEAARMKDHTKNCIYRDVFCYEKERELGCNKVIPLKDFATHLTNVHGCASSLETEVENFITIKRNESDGRWSPRVINNTFILYYEVRDKQIYCWVTMLGSEKEASGWIYDIEVKSHETQSKAKCCWTLHVLAHNSISACFMDHSHQFGILPIPSMFHMGEREGVLGRTSKVKFSVKIRKN